MRRPAPPAVAPGWCESKIFHVGVRRPMGKERGVVVPPAPPTRMTTLSEDELAEFREIFNLVDRDGGGTITKEELGELMDALGMLRRPRKSTS